MKAEKLIEETLQRRHSIIGWGVLAHASIFGYKNAPYTNYNNAVKKVKEVVAKMVEDGEASVDFEDDDEGYVYIVYRG